MSYGRTQPSAGPVEGAIHGAAVYLAVTVATYLTIVLTQTLASKDTLLFIDIGGGNFFTAATIGYNQLLILAPLVAVGLTVYYVATDRGEPAFVPAAVGAGVGTLLSGLLLLLLITVLGPDYLEFDVVTELIALGAITVGSVVAAILSGIGLDLV
jgi:hypothetical protein